MPPRAHGPAYAGQVSGLARPLARTWLRSARYIATSQNASTLTETMTIAQVAPVDAVVRAASTIAGLPPNQHHPPGYLPAVLTPTRIRPPALPTARPTAVPTVRPANSGRAALRRGPVTRPRVTWNSNVHDSSGREGHPAHRRDRRDGPRAGGRPRPGGRDRARPRPGPGQDRGD